MSTSSPHVKKANGEGKKTKRTASDSESDSDETSTKPSALAHDKSQTTILKEIKATFDFKGPKDFQKIRILGKGGVGRVYLVQLTGTDKLFAMKVLKQEEMISRNKVKRVLTEREVLATTRHPLIISLYYSFQSRSRLYFVMDYCAGGEFYRTIQMQPHKCLTEEQMRFYAAEVLLALEYLHAMGFVYRDLKPENILLHASGHIRLTDFDLSKASVTPVNAHVVQSMMGSPTMVAEPSLVTNSFVGTEEYLAPEVIIGKGYGASVDWWTYGILMYEMLYGVTPFRGKTQPDTFSKIEKSDLKFPDHPRAPVSKECKSLIKKLLSHDPKKRLGYVQGAAEIKAHPFFKDVNLQLILNSKPPIIPALNGPQDFRYFSTRLVDDDKDDDDLEFVNPDELDDDHPFKSFVPVDRDADSKAKAKSDARAASESKSSSDVKAHGSSADGKHKTFKKSGHGSSAHLEAGGNAPAVSSSSGRSTPTVTPSSPSTSHRTSKLKGSHLDIAKDDGHHHHHHKSKSKSRRTSRDEEDGETAAAADTKHHKHHHHHHRDEEDVVKHSPGGSHDEDEDPDHDHLATSSSEEHRPHHAQRGSNNGSADEDEDFDDEEAAAKAAAAARRKKKSDGSHGKSDENSSLKKESLKESQHKAARPRPPEDDDSSDEPKIKASGKVPRSRTPLPDEDSYGPSPTQAKVSKRHSTLHVPQSPTSGGGADEDDLPVPTKLKKSSTNVDKSSDTKSETSSKSHSRHSSSKRSHSPEPEDSNDSVSNLSSSTKSMKKVPSNLSDELDTVHVSKSSSKRSLAVSGAQAEDGVTRSSSRKGTPTSSKKHEAKGE